MTPHLHLHLEPEERMRRKVGLGARNIRSRARFFQAHDLRSSDRIPVTMDDVADFLIDLHGEQRDQGVHYAEVRISPRRLMSDGATLDQVLAYADRVVRNTVNPTLRLILLVNRGSPKSIVDSFSDRISERIPDSFVGLDLAGDEVQFPDIDRFSKLFSIARAKGLGVTVHAGEFGDQSNIWKAIDELGATRIAHGVSAVADGSLVSRLAADGILVEASVTSNQTLGAVVNPRAHPVRDLYESGVPVCFNADIPLHTGFSLIDELDAAAKIDGFNIETVKEIQNAAEIHAFGNLNHAPSSQRELPPPKLSVEEY